LEYHLMSNLDLLATAQEILTAVGALHRLVVDYRAALETMNRKDPEAQRRVAVCKQVLGEWRAQNRESLPALIVDLHTVRVSRTAAVTISGRSRASAVTWLVQLAKLARDRVLWNDRWMDELDLISGFLAAELHIDREQLAAEVEAELNHPGTMIGAAPTYARAPELDPAGQSEKVPLAALSEQYIASISGPVQRKLLRAVNGKGNVRIVEVLRAVYGSTDQNKEEALLKAHERVNRKLAEDGKDFELCRQGETLILSPL
jgi:hypothetical protein